MSQLNGSVFSSVKWGENVSLFLARLWGGFSVDTFKVLGPVPDTLYLLSKYQLFISSCSIF